jgi:hypothetical protein
MLLHPLLRILSKFMQNRLSRRLVFLIAIIVVVGLVASFWNRSSKPTNPAATQVPAGATTGRIVITTPNGMVGTTTFTVTP